MSETWVHTNIPTNLIDVPGYTCCRKDRLNGKGGGILIYIRESLKCSVMDLDTFGIECLALNVAFFHDFDELLTQINVKTETILMGDFNINWMDKERKDKL